MTSRHNELWTPEEVGRLDELAGDSTPVADIAAEFGRTEAAVRSKAYKENISLGTDTGGGFTDYVGRVMEDTRRCVREQTGVAMLGAAVAGLLLGLFIGGRRGRVGDEFTEGAFARITDAFNRRIPRE